MRTTYHEQLDALTHQLAEMCRFAGIAMERATQALLQADLVLAEQVIGDHESMTATSARAEEAAFRYDAGQNIIAFAYDSGQDAGRTDLYALLGQGVSLEDALGAYLARTGK